MEDKKALNIESEGEGKQYIVIRLGTEQYGIDIRYVDNIVRNQRITRIPKAQPYFKGVINLRGEIIPVMSIRTKFGLEGDVYTNATRIIIIKIDQTGTIGIMVDEVKEVVTLYEKDVEMVSVDTYDERTVYLSGIGKHGDSLISLLNINTVINE